MIAMILADGTIGQMMEPISFEDVAVEHYDKPWALTGTECKRKHNIVNSLYLQPDVLEKKNFERYEKYKVVEASEALHESYLMEDADVCVVAFGIAARVAKNAVVAARGEGIKAGMIRPITLWPFPEAAIRATLRTAQKYLCVEMSMGQMVDDVRLAVGGERPVEFYGRTGGMVPTVKELVDRIMAMAQPSGFAAQVDQAIGSVGEKLGEMGRKLDEKLNSPEFAEKTEALKKQASDMAGKAADGLAKGATLMAEGIGKAIDAIKSTLDDHDAKGGDQ